MFDCGWWVNGVGLWFVWDILDVGGDIWLCLGGVWWLSMDQGFYGDCWRVEGVGDY